MFLSFFIFSTILSICISTNNDQNVNQNNLKPEDQRSLMAAQLYLESPHVPSFDQAFKLVGKDLRQTATTSSSLKKNPIKPKKSQKREALIDQRVKTLIQKGDESSLEDLRKKAREGLNKIIKRGREKGKIIKKIWKDDPNLAKEVQLSKYYSPKPKGTFSINSLIRQRALKMFNRKEVQSIEEGKLIAFKQIQGQNNVRKERIAEKKKINQTSTNLPEDKH